MTYINGSVVTGSSIPSNTMSTHHHIYPRNLSFWISPFFVRIESPTSRFYYQQTRYFHKGITFCTSIFHLSYNILLWSTKLHMLSNASAIVFEWVCVRMLAGLGGWLGEEEVFANPFHNKNYAHRVCVPPWLRSLWLCPFCVSSRWHITCTRPQIVHGGAVNWSGLNMWMVWVWVRTVRCLWKFKWALVISVLRY